MKTLFLLITLTQNAAGDINASFVNAQTLELCQQKSLMAENIFSASNISVLENRCIQSDLQFSEFGHAALASMIQNYYLIYQDEETLQILPMSDWKKCIEKKKKMALQYNIVYCSSSIQSVQ